MARSPKTPKYNAFNAYTNCFGEFQDEPRELWEYLDSQKPLVLEIGCGKADLSYELAKQNPDKNYIGIDLKADRMYVAASAALEEGVDNIAFIQVHSAKLLEFVPADSTNEIWLTFPDPYPRKRSAKHRMSGREFLKLYHQLLKPGGIFHFKTDNSKLFDWSLEELESQSKLFNIESVTNDLHNETGYDEAKIITTYEKRFLAEGLKTNYLGATATK